MGACPTKAIFAESAFVTSEPRSASVLRGSPCSQSRVPVRDRVIGDTDAHIPMRPSPFARYPPIEALARGLCGLWLHAGSTPVTASARPMPAFGPVHAESAFPVLACCTSQVQRVRHSESRSISSIKAFFADRCVPDLPARTSRHALSDEAKALHSRQAIFRRTPSCGQHPCCLSSLSRNLCWRIHLSRSAPERRHTVSTAMVNGRSSPAALRITRRLFRKPADLTRDAEAAFFRHSGNTSARFLPLTGDPVSIVLASGGDVMWA